MMSGVPQRSSQGRYSSNVTHAVLNLRDAEGHSAVSTREPNNRSGRSRAHPAFLAANRSLQRVMLARYGSRLASG